MKGLALGIALVAAAQAPVPNGPAFEVASVKSSATPDAAMRINWPRGRFSAVNVSLRQLVQAAYVLEPFRLEGGPGWIDRDRFNVEATVSADTVIVQRRGIPDVYRLMMQTLLADRFRFVAHWEQKPQTVFALVVAKPGDPLRPSLHRSDADCASLLAAARQGGVTQPVAQCRTQYTPGQFTSTGLLLAQFADSLQSWLQQVVVDRTGLSGRFDVDLTWAPDPTAGSGPSLVTALQEQLGLKLVPTKEPVEILVIDRVEKPSPD